MSTATATKTTTTKAATKAPTKAPRTAPTQRKAPTNAIAKVGRKIAYKQNPKRLNTYQYGGTKAAEGIKADYTVSKGALFATYTPRAKEAKAWRLIKTQLKMANASAGDLKKASTDPEVAKFIAGALRHSARMGAIKVAA